MSRDRADAVRPDVHQRAAREVAAEPDVVLGVDLEAEGRADRPQLADPRQLVDEPQRVRAVAPHEALGQDETRRRRRGRAPRRPRPRSSNTASRR